MKILVTGMTPSQCARPTPLQLHNVGEIFAEALRRAGHEVEQRIVQVGENLDDYDRVLVGISPPLGLACRFSYPMLDVIARYGRRCAFFVDDFAFQQIINNMRTIVREPKRLTKELFSNRPGHDWAQVNIDYLMYVCEALLNGNWPPFIVGTWGHVDASPLLKAVPTRKLVAVDPTPLTKRYEHVVRAAPEDRERSWVLAALPKQDEKFMKSLGNQWPLRILAARKKGDIPRDALTEDQLVQMYGRVWGTIAPPYNKNLNGIYWRYRYIHAVRAGCISIGKDLSMLEPFRYGPQQLEQFTADQLDWVARSQAEALMAGSWSADRLISTLDEAVTNL